jgi:colicin import membrane protein
METTWDKLRAVVFALGLHALVLALLFVGLLTQPLPAAADAEGPIVEATLVSSPQQSTAIAKAIKAVERKTTADAAPPPQPKPSPKPEDAPQPPQLAPQAPLPKPDVVDQDEVRRAADLAAQQQKQEQEERRKQAQVDLTNQLLQQQQEQNRQRLAQQQLADIRKQRADAERQVKLQEQKMKQLQDQAARLAQDNAPPTVAPPGPVRPPSGNAGDKAGLLAKYKKAINETVQLNWHHDSDRVPERTHCIVQFKQLPGGEVFEVSFPDCPFDAAARDSVEAALKRTPLPYAGFETVFQPQGKIDMCYPEEACK